MYSRPNKKDFEEWSEECPNLAYENALKYFKKSENARLKNEDVDYHGHSGPLSVEDVKYEDPLIDTFIAANKELGRKEVDYNGAHQLGISKLQINTGIKCFLSGCWQITSSLQMWYVHWLAYFGNSVKPYQYRHGIA